MYQIHKSSQNMSGLKFASKKYRSASYAGTVTGRYRAALTQHPFLMFGLPFISMMVLGSFLLTPATALRFEKHDRKVKTLSKEDELGLGQNRRKVDIKDEYYVRQFVYICAPFLERITKSSSPLQRLAAKDLEDWEQVRVKRLPGESDGVL